MSKLTQRIDITLAVRAGAAAGLNLVAERVRAVAIPRTPMELGDLRSSLTVQGATDDDLESAVTSDSPYAVIQHEALDFHHKRGQAKYLESAALETAANEIEQIMAEAARKALG